MVEALDHLTIIGDATGGGSTWGMRALETALSGAGDFEVIGAIRGLCFASTNFDLGIYIRNDSLVYTSHCIYGTPSIRADSRTSPAATATSSIFVNQSTIGFPILMWHKISRVGSTMTFSNSQDGVTWRQHYTFTDANAFTWAGFFSESRNAAGNTAVECDSFSVNL
jgi:hypothetical protein